MMLRCCQVVRCYVDTPPMLMLAAPARAAVPPLLIAATRCRAAARHVKIRRAADGGHAATMPRMPPALACFVAALRMPRFQDAARSVAIRRYAMPTSRKNTPDAATRAIRHAAPCQCRSCCALHDARFILMLYSMRRAQPCRHADTRRRVFTADCLTRIFSVAPIAEGCSCR